MSQGQGDSLRPALYQGVIAGLISAILSFAGTYFITYQLVEKPRVAIEAEKEQIKLIPNIEVDCRSIAKDAWTWEVKCETKNGGTYPAIVKIDDVKVVRKDEYPLRQFYSTGQGFGVVYQDGQSSYRALPNDGKGVLTLYVILDKKLFPSGSGSLKMNSIINVSYKTLPEIVDTVTAAYSRIVDGDAPVISQSGVKFEMDLPTWTPPAPAPVVTPTSPVAAASVAVVPAIQAASGQSGVQDGNEN
ncbi:hypothetical protein [Burkholderia ubonensis]|uniref:hypothetical protein n=1 Tax=Burkholderia ubonensis TaxID=101571 RepID=UPI000A5C6E9D|nr:hypothetical protein [Burkholderia ubonensis]